jgi:hypothetical protein
VGHIPHSNEEINVRAKPTKKQPQTGTFTLDDVMEAVREDRQKDIEAGREYYPMNEERTRVAAGRVEVAAKVAIVEGAERQEETSPMDYSELLQAGIEGGILADAPTVEDVEPFRFGRTFEQAVGLALPPMAPSLEAEAVEIVSLLNDGVNRFVEAGHKLITHKARIDEAGEDWGLWVAKAFPAFAPRTLGRYMTLARRAEDGEAVVMLPASEDSEGPGDIIGLVPPVRDIHDLDETRYDAGEGEPDDDDDAPDLRQQAADEAHRKQQLAEAQARRRAKLAEAAGREIKPRKAKEEPTTIHVSTRSGTEKAVYDRVMFMVEKAEDEDQLRMIERHMAKVFPELARLATEAGLTGKG